MGVRAYSLAVGQSPVQVLNFEPEGLVRVTLSAAGSRDYYYVGDSTVAVDPPTNGFRLTDLPEPRFVVGDQDDLYVIWDETGAGGSGQVSVLVETDW